MHVPLNSRPACAQRSTVPHWKNIPSIARKLSSPSIGQIAHWLKSSPSGFEERPAQEPPQLRRSCSMGTCQPKPCQSLPGHKIHTVVSMRWGGTAPKMANCSRWSGKITSTFFSLATRTWINGTALTAVRLPSGNHRKLGCVEPATVKGFFEPQKQVPCVREPGTEARWSEHDDLRSAQ